MDKSPARKKYRGVFLNGVWHCECQPRRPADHFQTKNGGRNHGRWFYTCSKSQPKRCDFFLWDDEAKLREKAVVSSTNTTERRPQTPPGTRQPAQAQDGTRHTSTPPASERHSALVTPPSERTTHIATREDSDFDWSASNDTAMVAAAHTASMPPPETPRKVPLAFQSLSPVKRTHSEMKEGLSGSLSSRSNDDVFKTPQSSQEFGGLLSPIHTRMREKSQSRPVLQTPSQLAAEALRILQGSMISTDVENELVDLLNKHDLRTQGIAKGRDITRLALNNREKTISELEARVATLEAERETGKAVVAHLKRDLLQSKSSKSNKRER